MKLVELLQDRFIAAVHTLAQAQLPVEAAFKISEVIKVMKIEGKAYAQKRAELLDKYGQKDKSGKLKMNREKTVYLLKDSEGFKKEYDSLVAKTVEAPKISLEDLKSLKVSAQLLDSIRPILTP